MRRFLDPAHRAHVPARGVYTYVDRGGSFVPIGVSRQVVLFCVERRKNWRMLQSKAGVENLDYRAHRALLAKVDAGDVSVADLRAKGRELVDAEYAALKG